MIKVHHLIRYFLIIAIVVFVGYYKELKDSIFFFLIGPALHLAYFLKKSLGSFIGFFRQNNPLINEFIFLLPITFLYFAFVGFLLKQLWNEEGSMKFISLAALIGFLGYIHFVSGMNLLNYVTQNV